MFLNGIQLQHEAVQVLGVLLALRAKLNHLGEVNRGATVLPCVLQKRIGSCKLLAATTIRAFKRLFACVCAHVADNLVMLVERFLLDYTILPITSVVRLGCLGVSSHVQVVSTSMLFTGRHASGLQLVSFYLSEANVSLFDM